MMSTNENAIEIKDLSFTYSTLEDNKTNEPALTHINLNFKKGEFVVIMGPSGAGKSTLVTALNGLIPHFIRGKLEGTVSVLGNDTRKNKVSSFAKDIGLVFQDFEAQLFSTNVKLEIAFAPENFNVPVDEINKRINNLLKLIRLEGFEEREPSTLSGGQKQRLAIASVMSVMPQILCMDEPTTDLDPIGKSEVFEIASRLRKDENLTLIIIEHETEEALYADRIIFMQDGKVIADGNAKDMLSDVQKMKSIGLMPLQVPELFQRLGYKEELPMTPQEGFEKINQLGYVIDEKQYNEILKSDLKREKAYRDTLIKLEDVCFSYIEGWPILKNVNMEIKNGEFLAVLGQNGSGKTTLVKLLNALLKPTSGNVQVCGLNTKEHDVFQIGKKVGYVFQNPDHQIFAETVYDEVAFSPKIRGLSKEEVEQRVKEALEAVDLQGYEKEDPFTLTKGERQRVAVASILSARPDVIILDEPTTGLDYSEQRRMMELIKRLNENGHTIIIVTHSMWVVSEYAHKVAVMKNGNLIAYGKTREIFKMEDMLKDCFLKVPHIVSLSNKMGNTVLSIDEMIACLRRP
ncbi:MAG: transporter related [Clostridia bacterium]|jgi:energy-coupling factor transport system ATP-binding protein|uniref:ABC transporter ATP-binding protein n=1 Tax=Petroclostridium xylanilyticum TaxID=1792311 RepID=UPI0018E29FBF|nr:ABC transporter ATP-binding protein [Petroclostridium xylanilyticum]MBZ4645470.1 transporter related [Clostridia bacterium]